MVPVVVAGEVPDVVVTVVPVVVLAVVLVDSGLCRDRLRCNSCRWTELSPLWLLALFR